MDISRYFERSKLWNISLRPCTKWPMDRYRSTHQGLRTPGLERTDVWLMWRTDSQTQTVLTDWTRGDHFLLEHSLDFHKKTKIKKSKFISTASSELVFCDFLELPHGNHPDANIPYTPLFPALTCPSLLFCIATLRHWLQLSVCQVSKPL